MTGYWEIQSTVFALVWLVLTHHMIKYDPAKTEEYLGMYLKCYSPIFKPYVYKNESIHLKFTQDKSAFCYCYRRN